MREQRVQLGRERETSAARVDVVDDGLLAQPITREQQLITPRVPQCQRKHPPQALDARHAVLLVGVHHDLRIRLGGEAVAAGLELLSKLEEVVDLTVEDDAYAAVFVEDRLITCVQVDDRQAAHRQADLTGFRPEHPLAVWSAVAQCIVHALQHRAIGA